MHIFYCPHIIAGEARLSSEESSHCIRVLRLVKGDKVRLIDGKGGIYDAAIVQPDVRQCILEVLGSVNPNKNRSFLLHIAIAPTKSMERFEWFIEKSVEIGIDVITPLLCHRSERRMLKTDRLHKLIIATMKQAMVPFMPILNELTVYDKFIKSNQESFPNRFIAHCSESERKSLRDMLVPQSNVTMLIGPEGDFTPGEIELAIAQGYIPVSLGVNRLRTETAGIVACNIVNLINKAI